ncbi:PREDICTED: uncharacterized protein C17orf64 homolog [Tinamus guttatus]|uniref:uncharacterized protein C17orf64 homolog n=1 Tax=Tinamus guttatus TaxID=94827 RepID=UPI00052EE443|nr:PREDICTED: uncharacterized protein C17orf64 homolog [Tinamus guttatus]
MGLFQSYDPQPQLSVTLGVLSVTLGVLSVPSCKMSCSERRLAKRGLPSAPGDPGPSAQPIWRHWTAEQELLGTAGETANLEGSPGIPPGRAPLICCTEELDQDTFKICKEFLRPYKKSLRKLYLPQHVAREKKLRYTRESLTLLGDHISMFLEQHCKPAEVSHWKQMLWTYVSLFSEMDARQLHRLYRYTKNNQMDKFLKHQTMAAGNANMIFFPAGSIAGLG